MATAFQASAFQSNAFQIDAVVPVIIDRRGGADERKRWDEEWREDLQRIIDQAWRIAHGEINPVTLEEIPPPIPVDLTAINAALAGMKAAQDRQVIETFVAAQKLKMEEEAIAVLLLA